MIAQGILTSFGNKGDFAPMTVTLYFQSQGKIYELPSIIRNCGRVGARLELEIEEGRRSPLYNFKSKRPIEISGIAKLG